MTANPQPPPEAQLIHDRREAMRPKMSMRRAASEAGLSPERWRQIETGTARVASGIDVPVRDAPASTIAAMSAVVGITPAELTGAGRIDAARLLAELPGRQAEADPMTLEEMRQLSRRLTATIQALEAEDVRDSAGRDDPKTDRQLRRA
jgi:hypothetical protein